MAKERQQKVRRKIVAGNWKMNGSLAFVSDYFSALKPALQSKSPDVEVVLAPPFVLLPEVKAQLEDSGIQLSAQNTAAFESGAYTGEVSAPMLKDAGCQWCLVGHSERRAYYQESDQDVVAKVAQLLEMNIAPILCVGETLEEREADRAEDIVVGQVEAVFGHFDIAQLKNVVVAYEPVWAIGTGKTATPEQAQEMHRVIRNRVAEVSEELAGNLVILYGGSVNAGNAADLFSQEDIDGGLVGGASLKAEEFSQICEQMG